MKYLLIIAVAACLSGCTFSANRPLAHEDWPDASTPKGMNEFNAGILDNHLMLNGRPYDTVTPNLADKIAKWQGNRDGFIIDPRFEWKGSTAIDKAIIFAYSFR